MMDPTATPCGDDVRGDVTYTHCDDVTVAGMKDDVGHGT